jgi:fructose-1,6-bisphosphatase II / sedoheptulose-1,7-bisphosphatase
VLDRARHEAMIAELRALGCGIRLIPDGDVAGVIAVTNEDTGVDLYMGSGGAPEGVLAAAALRCVGGQFKGRLLFRNEAEKAAPANGASPISTRSTISTTWPRATASLRRPA